MADSQINEQSRRLKKIRESLGWSQSELANKLGVNQTYLSAIENGKRGISRNLITRLADLLPNLNVQWLIKGDGQMNTFGAAISTGPSTGNSVQVIDDSVQLMGNSMANEDHVRYGSTEDELKHLRLRINRLEQFILKKFPDYPLDSIK